MGGPLLGGPEFVDIDWNINGRIGEGDYLGRFAKFVELCNCGEKI